MHRDPRLRPAQFRACAGANFEQLVGGSSHAELHETIHSFAHTIAEHPVEILPGVPETLQYLGGRHHLILMTKGAWRNNPAKSSAPV